MQSGASAAQPYTTALLRECSSPPPAVKADVPWQNGADHDASMAPLTSTLAEPAAQPVMQMTRRLTDGLPNGGVPPASGVRHI